MELTHIAQRDGRLSSFLKSELGMSSGLVNRLKWAGRIWVNGRPEHNDYPVRAGDVITAQLDDPTPEYPAQQGPLTVLYEDSHLLAVEKPAGMLVHPSRSCNTGTLANFVLGYFQKTGQACACHPITRLDRDTFGVVLLAKNSHVHALLTALQSRGALEKTYEAWVCGGPAEDRGQIDAPIARREKPSLLRYVDPSGKPSRTRFTVLRRQEGRTLLALEPLTGRTHQLRVHCAHRGFPILGDPQYGSSQSQALSATLGLTGQVLCARRLRLPHPVTGEPLELTSRQALGL